jgi:hypothetical protein
MIPQMNRTFLVSSSLLGGSHHCYFIVMYLRGRNGVNVWHSPSTSLLETWECRTWILDFQFVVWTPLQVRSPCFCVNPKITKIAIFGSFENLFWLKFGNLLFASFYSSLQV